MHVAPTKNIGFDTVWVPTVATIVFGLDGGNWDLIRPWIEDGTLPNIHRLQQHGLWGISESVLPPVTCPNWKCYASSRSSEYHDIYWWEQVDKQTMHIDVPDSTSFTTPELWDYLNDEGCSTAVLNLPMSYPPRELNGVMVAGGPRSREEGFTYPPELESELVNRGYRVHPETVITSNQDDIEPTLELLETRFETAQHLLAEHEFDFLHLTIFHLNVLQHYFWNDTPVKRAWEIIDEHIGHFLDEGHTIVLMSDHGCTEINTVFHVNEWLQEEGYLTMETSFADYLMKAGITQERLAGLVRSLNLESTLRKHFPRRIIERFPDEEGIKRDNKFDKILRDETNAIASGQGLLYVLHDPESDKYDQTVTELVKKLSQLQTPSDTPLASTVYRGDELYPNGNPRFRPDVVFEQGPGVHTSGAVGKDVVFDSPGRWRAENIREGMFLAHGDQIEPAGDIGMISILDIAPTVLYSMGLDIPEDFEGEPIRQANQQRDDITYRSPLPDRDAGTRDRGDDVKERLANLGYLE